MAFPQLSIILTYANSYTIISLILRPKHSNFHYLPHIRICMVEDFVNHYRFFCSIACWWPCRKAIICNMIISVFSFHFKLFETVTIISGKIYLPITCWTLHKWYMELPYKDCKSTIFNKYISGVYNIILSHSFDYTLNASSMDST